METSWLTDVFLHTNIRERIIIEACGRWLVELLLHPSPSVLIPALRTVCNIVTDDDFQAQYIINNQAFPCLLALLTHNHKKRINKEACWTISNITASDLANYYLDLRRIFVECCETKLF
ncbi:hypothetical protein SUGI_0239820 [Cryptomeria japonica]|nr:hypothetical protein SUGI_0239820 [Cryptomeria japonica]